MKVFVYFAVLAFVSANALDDATIAKIAEQKKKAKEHIDFCVDEIKVDAELPKKLTAGDFSQNDHKAQCFVNCVMKRVGFMNESGESQKDVIIDTLAKKAGVKHENLEDLITKCVASTGADHCETAYKIYECYWTNRVVDTADETEYNLLQAKQVSSSD